MPSSLPDVNDPKPFTLLIAALGGEGGGVLNDWIVQCALAQGLPVQATSVPGVAQRTGSTSYYIEMMRTPAPEGAQPVFALNPMPGGVDVVLASELVEAGRMIERGFVHPKRTTLIAASHRVYTTQEKMQMGDGRFDDERIHAGARTLAARYLSLDMASIAAAHGTVISAVMFGALAGAGVLPWSREVCERVIREGGVGVQASLAGFASAFEAVAAGAAREALAGAGAGLAAKTSPEIWAPLLATLPEPMRANAAYGLVRLLDYQDAAYGRLYVERLQRIAAAAGDPHVHAATADALSEAARHLALWMSYEDVIRVADLKTRRSRVERIRSESRARDGEIVQVVEYLKPGVDEVAAILPRGLGERLRGWAVRRGKLDTLNRGLHLPSTTVHGYLLLRLLARLRPLRRRSLRFHEEQQAIERWLAALERMLPASPAFAAALASLPRVLKGYGDTQRRGRASFTRIFGTLVERTLAADGAPAGDAVQALQQAIDAALAEPEGRQLERSLELAGITPLPPPAKPIVWMKKPRGTTPTGVSSR
jgi:indolepyruvate ferredoxin oxidoreductase beta subunit